MNIYRIYDTLSRPFRRRRMRAFLALLKPAQGAQLLDLGGFPWTWAHLGVEFPIICLNTHIPKEALGFAPRIVMVLGDATRLEYADGSFEIVYSNSVVEHLGTWERQRAFAREARRVGRRLWIQTPARSFIIEPHLLAPLIHFLPKSVQARLIRYFTPWGLITKPTAQQIRDFLEEVRLLSYAEMKQLFPDCRIMRERFLWLVKSYIAVRT